MYLLIIIFPFIGSAAAGLLGRLLGIQGSILFVCTCIIISAIISIIAFYEVCLCGSPITINIGSWFLGSNWAFLFDGLSVSLLIAVIIVAIAVHIFAGYYRGSDPHVQRFFCLLSIFTGSMAVLASGDNYLVLFLGWEAIGITSFLLIGFWWTRIDAVRSAIQAILYNRVGDTCFSLGIFIMLWMLGSADFGTVFGLSSDISWNLVILLFLGGAIAKSAQVPMHVWLPYSMEGPTPVSALLHAATLVTAGVYLLLRSSPLLQISDVQLVVALIGAITALIAATTGLVQNDIKRIIAYSTISQIGYRICAVGLGFYDVSLFHLCNHAFFKALLFLGAGGTIHGLIGEQDIRRLGGVINVLPYTYVAILIGSMALVAFPFTTGIYSKEILINLVPSPIYECLLVGAALTAFYSARLLYITFIGKPRSSYGSTSHPFGHEVPGNVIFSYTVLSLAAIFFGWLANDAFIGPGSDIITGLALQVRPGLIEAEAGYNLLPIFATFIGIGIYLTGIFAYGEIGLHTGSIYRFLINRWVWEDLLQSIPRIVLSLGNSVRKNLDRGVLELIGPRGLSESIYQISDKVATKDRMRVTNIALFRVIFAIIIAFASLTTFITVYSVFATAFLIQFALKT